MSSGACAWRPCEPVMPESPPPLLDAPSADEYLAEFDQDSTDLAGVLQTTSVMRRPRRACRI